MQKRLVWAAVAVFAVAGFVLPSRGSATEPTLNPMDGNVATEGRRGYRPYRRHRGGGGFWIGGGGGYWGPRHYYGPPRYHYYAPPPPRIYYAPPPVVYTVPYYGGTVIYR